jgi:hypothetical protein
MARTGEVRDRGNRLEHVDKPLQLQGASWIEPQGVITLFEDFLVDVLADTPYVTVTQSGTPIAAAAISATAGAPGSTALGGWCLGSTSSVDAEIDEIAFGGLGTGAGTPWMRADRAGNGVLVAEFGFVIPTALTARQYTVGLSDDPVEGTGTNGYLNIASAYTITDVASDAAAWIFSSLATAPTVWKYGATKANAQSTASAATEGVTGVVDQYTVCRIEVDVLGNAYFYQSISGATTSGRLQPTHRGTLQNAVTPTVGLLPKMDIAPTTTTTVDWELDYCFASQAR